MRKFEKNIHQKASDFQMQPDVDSFEKVMAALEKKKKRRFILWIWWLIPGLALGAGIIIPKMLSNVSMNASGARLSFSEFVPASKKTMHSIVPATSHSTGQPSFSMKEQQHGTTTNAAVKGKEGDINHPTFSHATSEQNIHVGIGKTEETSTHAQFTESTHEKDQTTIQLPERNSQSTLLTFEHAGWKYIPNIVPYNRNNDIKFLHPTLNNRNQHDFSRFSIGAYADLGVMKSIFINNKDSAGQYYTNNRQSADRFLFSYSAGILFRFSPVKFLTIETGIGYSHYASQQMIGNSGVITSSSQGNPDTIMTGSFSSPVMDAKEFNNVYGFVSVPLKVYYQKRWNWIAMEAGGGVVFDIPVNTYSYVSDDDGMYSYLRNDVKQSRLNSFGLQVGANVHAVFHANKFSFFAGPTFRYRTNSLFDNQYIIQQHHYFIGAETGARFNF